MTKSTELTALSDEELQPVLDAAIGYIQQARQSVLKSVNTQQVIAYWHVGKIIVEKEQDGQLRANYGQQLIKLLSKRLNNQFKRKGFGPTNLSYMKRLYLAYPERIFTSLVKNCYMLISKRI